MKNPVAQRIYEFTKLFPPFNLMDAEDLLQLCETALVRHFAVGEYLFEEGDEPHDRVYLLREGAIDFISKEGEQELLLETHDEGDVIGLRPLISRDDYAASALIKEEAILYAFKQDQFLLIMQKSERVSNYLLRTFAALARSKYETSQKSTLRLNHGQKMPDEFPLQEVQVISPGRNPVFCKAQDSILLATEKMNEANVGSMIVVDENKFPIGVFTDRDLRKIIATGNFQDQQPVHTIMNTPVITIAPNVPVADVQIKMVKNKIHHICVTKDGSDQSEVVGVISNHDLLLHQGNNPAILIREIHRAQSGDALASLRDKAEVLLKKYIYQEVSIQFTSTIMSEINDAIIIQANKIVEEQLAGEGKKKPSVNFCWLAIGSEGRREQLLRTDQDNALVYEAVPDNKVEEVKAYFLEYAEAVTKILNEVGFEYCPANMMASNPKWCLSIAEWNSLFSDWIHSGTSEDLMMINIFFDFRPIYGDFSLGSELAAHIHKETEDKALFFSRLAKNAQENPPPLTFFRNFMVERGGAHKDKFDIKARAMMPLTDAARVLILQHRITEVNNTVRRFETLAELEPQNSELFMLAGEAYETFMRFRVIAGLENMNSGRYLDPSLLNKLERMQLRYSFGPIADIQTLLKVRFQTAFLG